VSRRRAALALGLLLAIGLAGWLGSAAWVAWWLTRPAPRAASPLPEVAGAAVHAVEVEAADGVRLAGTWLEVRGATRAVLLLHGSDESRERWYALLPELAQRHMAALAVDLRAHGQSGGDVNDFGWSARLDLAPWLDFLARRQSGARVVVAGFSMGAAAALFAAPDLGARVQGYVLESCYLDLASADARRLHDRLPGPLAALASLGLRIVEPLVLGFDPRRTSPAAFARRLPPGIPVAVLGALEDTKAPAEDQRALARLLGDRARLVLYAGAGHRSLAERDPQRLAALLEALTGDG
jgi:alpha-beta hydrolase superfamily lysophospholipase